jgi:hypothetical protein
MLMEIELKVKKDTKVFNTICTLTIRVINDEFKVDILSFL